MRVHVSVGLVGVAIGLGVALAGHASADAIDDAWPYGGTGAGSESLALPGYLFIAPGSGTNEGQNSFGPITTRWGDYVATHTAAGSDDWYAVHDNTSILPGLYTNEHTEVTSVLDDSAGYPSVGTVFDKTVLFQGNSPIGAVNWFTNSTINDPELGYANQFTMWPFFGNTYLSTDDGIKDVVTSFGQQFTLFEIPSTDASDAADSSDAGDAFTQLLAELTDGAPSAADLA